MSIAELYKVCNKYDVEKVRKLIAKNTNFNEPALDCQTLLYRVCTTPVDNRYFRHEQNNKNIIKTSQY